MAGRNQSTQCGQRPLTRPSLVRLLRHPGRTEGACRETREEIGVTLTEPDLHLFGIITEKHYEANGHWMMFLFDCRVVLENLPPDIEEGEFAFHEPSAIDQLPIPETDRKALWPIYFKNRKGFVSLRADCHPDTDLKIIIEEQF